MFISPAPFCFAFECGSASVLEPGLPPLKWFPFPVPTDPPAVIVHVESGANITFGSRIRDTSRESDTAGTEIPVVREDDMSAGRISLLNIPLRARFRSTLRIYALPEVDDPQVDVRYFRMQKFGEAPQPVPRDIVLLRSDRVSLRKYPQTDAEKLNGIPGVRPSFLQIGNFETYPELAGEEGVWIEITPVTPALRFWAFVSVTNNDTQQVTIISPQRSYP